MVVQLVAHTPEPEKIVAAAAKLCYSPVGVNELMDHLKDADVERFLEKLIALGHESPLEHITFTFAVEGVSRVLTHQLVRHRIASYSQQSQRYVKLEAFEYIIPPAILENETAKALFVESMQYNQRCYDQLVSILMDTYTKRYMSDGVPEKRAQNMAEKSSIEDARFVFPNACETKIIVTMNARSLLNFFNHRLCNRAQWEIRELATKMLVEVKRVAPHIFKQAGPPCLSEKCPEGAMTCGKITEVRTFFRQLD